MGKQVSDYTENIPSGPSTGSGGRFSMLGGLFMTGKELSDNLIFFSALKLMEQLAKRGLLDAKETQQIRRELEYRLRPTLLLI